MVAIKEANEHHGHLPNIGSCGGANEASELLDRARSILKRRLSFFVWQGFFEPLFCGVFIRRSSHIGGANLFSSQLGDGSLHGRAYVVCSGVIWSRIEDNH